MNYFPHNISKKDKELFRREFQKGMIKIAVPWFSREMESELTKHVDRPGWKREAFNFLYGRLCEEVIELDKALFENGRAIRKKNSKQIVKECADVANFAMMIADNIK